MICINYITNRLDSRNTVVQYIYIYILFDIISIYIKKLNLVI